MNKLTDFTKGWVIGDFLPALFTSKDVEVAIKKYRAGDHESRHHHKIATEYTIIVEGMVEMNGITYYANDIITIKPNESTDFKAVSDVITVVIKTPSVINDKYE